MDYLLLGPMRVVREGQDMPLGGLRQRAVLGALLLEADHTVDVDTLIDAVWDDEPPPKPIASLRAYVANLRRVLDDGRTVRLVTDGRGYRLRLGSDGLDILEFESLVGEGKRLLDGGDAAGADNTLRRALALWRGTPLSDFRHQEFAHDEIRRLEALRTDTAEAGFEAALQLGHSTELIGGLEAEVAANPLRERLWAQLMLALYRSGRRGDALAAYDRLHVVLDRELGVGPGLALDRLASEIRCESADLDWTPSHTTVNSAYARPRGALFGRSAEQERLRDALRAAAEGRGGIAVLVGDSGVGKTALAADVVDTAVGFGVATVWAGHSGGVRKPPMWAWNHLIGALGGVAETARARGGFELIEETAAAVAELAARRPVVLVLDDLHRADRLTHDVLELLAATIHRQPMLIVATWQDGGVDVPVRARAFDRLLSRCDVTTMRLRGLASDAVAELVEDIGGVIPTVEMIAEILARTGGNPFYTRELTRMLRDSGRLDASTRHIDGDDIPDAVAGVIRRRLADLPRDARAAVVAAAVLGTEFDVAVLATVLGAAVPDASAGLEPALRSGLLLDVADQPGRYRFRYGLVRDAVAAVLTGVPRARTHAEIARAYADDAYAVSEGQPVVGADHAWRAGTELEPEIALDLIDRARSEACTRAAYTEVAELDRRALSVCMRLPIGPERFEREADLRLQLASVEAVVNGRVSAAALDALHHASEEGSRTGHFASSVALRCLARSVSAQYREAATLSDGLIEFYDSTGDPIAGTAGYYFRGLVDFMLGRFGACLESTATLLDDVPAVDWKTHGNLLAFDMRGYGLKGWAHAMHGDMERASATMSAGIDIGDARDDVFATGLMRTAEIQLNAITGCITGTEERAQRVVDDLTLLGIDHLAASGRVIGGWAKALGPNGVDTTDEVRDALVVHSQGGTRIFTALYLALLSDIEAIHRSPAAARTTLHKAELMAAATGERVWDTQLSARRLKLRADSYRSGGSVMA